MSEESKDKKKKTFIQRASQTINGRKVFVFHVQIDLLGDAEEENTPEPVSMGQIRVNIPVSTYDKLSKIEKDSGKVLGNLISQFVGGVREKHKEANIYTPESGIILQ